ncbi:MAG: cyclic nucleotide-binding domain-containing protein [Actinomycetota bacterium]|nr:cyclic nucleotide-binding domain-containing protein [Actinomycetota bacterium]
MTRRADERVALLHQVQLFSKCSKTELKRVASLATPVDVEEEEVLTREGQPGSELFVIGSGSARVTLQGAHVATLLPGDAFGEMALLDGGPRAATVTANTPMSVYVLGPREFSTLLQDVPQIGRSILKALAHRLREAEKQRYGSVTGGTSPTS